MSRARVAPPYGASLLIVVMRRGYNRAFPRLVRIGFANYWRWNYSLQREKLIKIDALCADKKKKRKSHNMESPLTDKLNSYPKAL